MATNVESMDQVVENRWFEILEEGVVIRTVIEFPRRMYHRGHPFKKLRVNTFYYYQDRSIKTSVDEYCSDEQPYEAASLFFSRP